jgi:hypothetical protein
VVDQGEAIYHLRFRDLDHAVQEVIDDAVRRVIKTVLEADRKPDGGLRQDNVFCYVIAPSA